MPQEKCNFGRQFSFAKEAPLTGYMNDVSASSCMGTSPFPAVDKFVQSVASTGSVSGSTSVCPMRYEREMMVICSCQF